MDWTDRPAGSSRPPRWEAASRYRAVSCDRPDQLRVARIDPGQSARKILDNAVEFGDELLGLLMRRIEKHELFCGDNAAQPYLLAACLPHDLRAAP